MRRRGRSGWMSRSFFGLRERFFSVTVRTRGPCTIMLTSPTNSKMRIGVLGYGYWGPNIVRNLRSLDGCQVAMVCDRSSAALKRLKQAYPDQAVTTDPVELLTSAHIDAVAVVTPVCTHFELAKAALQNGKHVFIEKP